MPRLSIAHLQMLTTIRQSPSHAEAAARLAITPSALTHRIREAERRLGVALFARSGRRVRPTAAAEILTETAEHVLGRLALAETAAAASAEGVRHVVRLTVCDYNAYHWLADFLARFRTRHPEIDVEIEPGGTTAAFRRLAERELDIAVLPEPGDGSELEGIALFRDELVVTVWPDHPLATRPFARARDFETETYLTYSLASRPGFEAERLWMEGGTLPRRKRNLGSVDAVCELVKARAGISVLSRWGITREVASGALAALRTGREGLPLVWCARTAPGLHEDAPAWRTVLALRDWFAARGGAGG